MFKPIKHFCVGVLLLAPLALLSVDAKDYVQDIFPVYSDPTLVEYKVVDEGFKVSFEIEKLRHFEIPKDKADQDVFAVLEWDDNGTKRLSPANVYPFDNPQRPFKNVLIVGEPGVIGPFYVEVPDRVLASLEEMTIKVRGERWLFGTTYEEMGPFDLTDAREMLVNLDGDILRLPPKYASND